MTLFRSARRVALAALLLALLPAQAQNAPVRVRGTVQAVGADTLTVKDRSGELVQAPGGRTMRLKHKNGQADIVVPDDTPVVSMRPGDRSLLVPDASVSLTAQQVDGQPTVLRISAGRNGFALPY